MKNILKKLEKIILILIFLMLTIASSAYATVENGLVFEDDISLMEVSGVKSATLTSVYEEASYEYGGYLEDDEDDTSTKYYVTEEEYRELIYYYNIIKNCGNNSSCRNHYMRLGLFYCKRILYSIFK